MRHVRLVPWLPGLTVLVLGGGCETLPLVAPTDSTVVVVANPAELALGDPEGSAITARVTESAGTAVPNGTVVTFSTSLGSFDRTEAPTSGGAATVNLRAGQLAGTATVRAFSGSAASEPIQVRIGVSGREIVVGANPFTIPVGGSSEITATVTEASGAPVRDGIVVNFSTTLGSLLPISADTVNGRASVTLRADTPGTAQVTASSGDVTSLPITVRVGTPTPASSTR